jgi:hypothetical protein
MALILKDRLLFRTVVLVDLGIFEIKFVREWILTNALKVDAYYIIEESNLLGGRKNDDTTHSIPRVHCGISHIQGQDERNFSHFNCRYHCEVLTSWSAIEINLTHSAPLFSFQKHDKEIV